ncbi:error-prone DNA polymerase [Parasalinivibrio latis]|uniref:error-prone DNA polymerase n=1 Tax=Parasalinivibrio latis TaxID=2952610 RepID=UPI0030E0D019
MVENTGYAELHCNTNFSFLTGASHPEELIIQADRLGYQALAITDECSVAGVVKAFRAIEDEKLAIKLIVGSEFLLEGETLVLLCPNKEGWVELCTLITTGRTRSPKGKYRIEREDFNKIAHCLCIWVPCYPGSNRDQAGFASWLKKRFPRRLWIGASRLLRPQEQAYLSKIETLSEQLNCPVVSTNHVQMHDTSRQPLHDVLTAIRTNTPISQCGTTLCGNTEKVLKPLDKLAKLYPTAWLEETRRVAGRCYFSLDELRYQYPAELVPPGFTATSWLRHLVERGIRERFGRNLKPQIRETIEKELTLIAELQYEYFFLTIHDIVHFARSRQILYQGRGSAANSVVCYCLGITAVNPEQINVLFERFISKERNEPPDIDVDFEHQRREEVFQYIYQKYGRNRAALAATVITYRFKSALRDVGKALGICETQLDFFIKNINHRDRSLDKTEQLSSLGLSTTSHTGQWLLKLVNEIKGFPRHLSQHVGGFVISAGPLHELVPIENAAMADRTVIQWDKDDLETLKLLKVDILALGMLTAIRKTLDLLEIHHRRRLTLADIGNMGDDPKVYNMLQHGDSVGVFQIESRAQMSMLPRLKPKSYYDLVIQIAIVRPGPIQGDMVHPFLRRRWGIEKVSYPSEEVRGVLERTMGVPIFQEQVIQLAMVAAGFTGGEADQLRRAMASWKKTGYLEKFRSKLIDGMESRGYPSHFAEQLYRQIQGFGEYGFPESHSASFAVLAYVSSWLKYYYPAAFYCGLLNSQPMGFYSPSQLIQDAIRHQVEVLPVCINNSEWDHTLTATPRGMAIQLGMRLVKGLAKSCSDHLVNVRPENGFQALHELSAFGVNKRDLEALASANATQGIAGNRFNARWQMMDESVHLPIYLQASQGAPLQDEALPSPSELDNLMEDYDSTGLTLGKHPITLLDEAGRLGRHTLAKDLVNVRHGAVATVVGVVTGRQRPGTSSGVTFVTLEDQTGNINVVVWLATARAQSVPFLTSKILKVSGIVEKDGEVIHLIAGKMEDMTAEINKLAVKSRDFH